MLYKVKNISKDNIEIEGKVVKPGIEVVTNDLKKYKHMINRGFMMLIKEEHKYTEDMKKLLNQINDLQQQNEELKNKEPIEKIIEKPVEKVIEKIIEKPKVIEKIIEKPVEKIIEKIVEKPVERIIEKPVIIEKEKIVEKQANFNLQDSFNNIVNLYDKDKVIEALFHMFIDRNVDDNDLRLIKTFYKHIGITKLITDEKLQLIEDAENYEELIAVLLNTVYPCLFQIT